MKALEAKRGGGIRSSFLPIPGLVILIVVLELTVDPSVFYDPLWLILIGNTLFVTGVSLIVSYIALKNYKVTGRIQIFMLGCGVLVFGIGGVLAAAVRSLPDGANLNVTIYNTGALLGAVFHFVAAFILLAGISPEVGFRRRRTWLFLGYGGAILFMALVTAASLYGFMPPFFVQGVGPTLVRQQVLGTADILFVFSSLVFLGTHLRNRESFLYWYGCALALTAISLTAFFIQSSVGSPVGWIGRFSQYLGGVYFLASLITANRSAQSRGTSLDNVLRESLSGAEEKFRALAENAPDVIRRFDRELKQIYVNAAGLRLYGKPAGAILGRPLQDAGLPEAQCRIWAERILRVFKTGERLEVEDYLPTAKGTGFYLSQCVPEYGPEGEVANVLVVSRDLTERKRAEEALNLVVQKYSAMISMTSDGVWIHNLQGEILEVNDAYCRMCGYSREELLNSHISRVEVAETTPEIAAHIQKVLQQGGHDRFESRHRRKDGSVFDVDITALYLDIDGGRMAVFVRDITPRKQTEKALQEAQAKLQTHAEELEKTVARRTAELRQTVADLEHFSYAITHDMRAPLRAMQGFTSMLEDECAGCQRPISQEYYRRIKVAADRLDHLITDSLNYGKTIRQELPLEMVDLDELMHGLIETYPNLQPDKADIEIVERLPLVLGNQAALTQCFSNLLGNAVKFAKPGTKPCIRVRGEKIQNAPTQPGQSEISHPLSPKVRIWVEDNGIGMPKECLERIFDLFQRATTKYEGTGLGLSIVRKVVERMGGRVGVESEPGQGSRFWVELQLCLTGS